jgi:excisionase family DNA binding protein
MKQLATVKEIAEMLAVHPATVWRMVERGDLPPPIRMGSRCTRWSLEAVQAAIERLSATPAKGA